MYLRCVPERDKKILLQLNFLGFCHISNYCEIKQWHLWDTCIQYFIVLSVGKVEQCKRRIIQFKEKQGLWVNSNDVQAPSSDHSHNRKCWGHDLAEANRQMIWLYISCMGVDHVAVDRWWCGCIAHSRRPPSGALHTPPGHTPFGEL